MSAVTNTTAFTVLRTLDGWPVAVSRTGRLYPIVRGGAEGDPPAPTPPPTPTPAPTPTPTPTPAPAPPADLAAIQAQIDAATASGSQAALQPLMDLVGAKTPAELQKWITDADAARKAALTEEQRRTEELAERERTAATATATAGRAIRNAMVQAALVTAGAPPLTSGEIVALVALPDGDVDAAAITAAVEATKVKFPALFGTPAPGGLPPAPSGGAPGAPRPAADQTDPMQRGKDRAAAVKEARPTQSLDPTGSFRTFN